MQKNWNKIGLHRMPFLSLLFSRFLPFPCVALSRREQGGRPQNNKVLGKTRAASATTLETNSGQNKARIMLGMMRSIVAVCRRLR